MNFDSKTTAKGLLIALCLAVLIIFGLGVCSGVAFSEELGPEIWHDDMPHKILQQELDQELERDGPMYPPGYWDESGIFFPVNAEEEENPHKKHTSCLMEGTKDCAIYYNECHSKIEDKQDYKALLKCLYAYHNCEVKLVKVCKKSFPVEI